MFEDNFRNADPVAPQPVDIKPNLGEPQPFPINALSPNLRRATEALMSIVQVPAALAAQSVLAACSLVAQIQINIQLPTREEVPAALFLFTIAVSGDRKSSTDKLALAPIYEKESRLRDAFEGLQASFNADLAAYNVAIANAKKGKSNREETKRAIEAEGLPPTAPALPLILVEEPTIEGMTKLLDEAYPFIGLFSDEGAKMIGGYAMKEENQAASGAALSQLWDGKTIKRVRGTDVTKYLSNRRASLHLMLQPSVALPFFGNKALRGQGLMSRLLVAYPESLKGTRLWKEAPREDWDAMGQYWARLGKRTDEAFSSLDLATRAPQIKRALLTADATATWIAFSDHIEKQQAPGAQLEEVSDFASKAAQHATRLAAVMAVFEHGAAKVAEEGISNAAMICGIKLVEYYLSEALRLYNGGSLDDQSENAAALIEFIRKKGVNPVGKRWLSQSAPKHLRAARVLGDALDLLVDEGHLVKINDGASITVGEKAVYERNAYAVVRMDA